MNETNEKNMEIEFPSHNFSVKQFFYPTVRHNKRLILLDFFRTCIENVLGNNN